MKTFVICLAFAGALFVMNCLTGCAVFGPKHAHYSTNVITLNSNNFDQQILASSKPALVDFWAPWCGPCREMVPTISQLADTYHDVVVFGSVNVDDEEALSQKYNIEGLPSVFLFKDGKKIYQLEGLREKQEFEDLLHRVINGAPLPPPESSSDTATNSAATTQ